MPFGLKNVFEKLRFRDGLVWMVGLAAEIMLRFQILFGEVSFTRYIEMLLESCQVKL